MIPRAALPSRAAVARPRTVAPSGATNGQAHFRQNFPPPDKFLSGFSRADTLALVKPRGKKMDCEQLVSNVGRPLNPMASGRFWRQTSTPA